VVEPRVLHDRGGDPGSRRYRCNDFDPDEDFDDLIFSVIKKSRI